MKRMRTFCRAVADSLLLWMVLGICAAVALGSALGPSHPANLEEASAGRASAPSLPCQLFLEAGRQAVLVGASFDSHVPAVRSGLLLSGPPRIEKGCGREEQHRISLLAFGPLHRRPPPSFS